MKSILQEDTDVCYLCGRNRSFEPLDKHHVFGGYARDVSEEYGLFVYLHSCNCHKFGINSVHMNHEIMLKMRKDAQAKAMEHYHWTIDDFRKIIGKSYL